MQDGDNVRSAEISKREKARLREMQQLKKQKLQEILDAQNAAIDADMVCLVWERSYLSLGHKLCQLFY